MKSKKFYKNLVCYRKKDMQIGHICDYRNGIFMWWPYDGSGMQLLTENEFIPKTPTEYYYSPYG